MVFLTVRLLDISKYDLFLFSELVVLHLNIGDVIMVYNFFYLYSVTPRFHLQVYPKFISYRR
jgi:hypothetical protein